MKKILVAAGVVIIIAAIIVAGFIIRGQMKDESKIYIGVSQANQETYWDKAVTKFFEKTFVEKENYVLTVENGEGQQETQKESIKRFIDQKVDYIILYPVVEDGWDEVLKEAQRAEIPVIVIADYVNVERNDLYKVWVGSNYVQQGLDAAAWLEETLKEKDVFAEDTNIVTIQAAEGSRQQQGRTEGFHEKADTIGQWKMLEEKSADGSKDKAKEVMAQFLKDHKDIDVVVVQGDEMMLGAVEAIEAAGKTCGENGDIILISFDGTSEAFDMMEAGKLTAAVETSPVYSKTVQEIIQKLERNQNVDKIEYIKDEIYLPENAKLDRVGRLY